MADADPDTWSLPSEARPAPLDTLDTEGARAASPAESVRRLYSELDEELLRGVALSECLRNCGQHWQRPLAESMHDIEKQSYGKSFKVARYHHFLSHDWETSGTKKVSSVLLLTNSLAACLATMFCSVLVGLVRDTRRPEGLRPQRHASSFLPYVAYLFFLLFWQTLRTAARRPVVVFHDRLCIAQHDGALKQKGILGLSAFLDRSEHMIILWSHRYFTRMWCCYELATYLRHPEAVRPLTLFAVDMSVVILSLKVVGVLLIVQAQMRNLLLGDDLQLRVLFGTQAIIGFGFFSSVAVYWTVGVSKDLTDLEPQLSEFRVQFAETFCCTSQHVGPSGQVLACDRQLIFEAIRDWYGAGETEEQLEDFNRTVRATLKRRALEGAQTATVPLSIMLYSALCTVAPLVCDGVTHIKAIWHWRSDVGPWLALWRSLAVLSWLASYAYTGVLWYHLFVKVCQVLYPYLEKMTRWKQTLLPWCANTGLGLMMLGIFVWPYEVLDQAGHGDFWPLLAAILLLPGVYIFSLRSCRCSQCFTNIFQFKGFKRVAIK